MGGVRATAYLHGVMNWAYTPRPLAITSVVYIVCGSLPTWADDVVCMVGKCIRHMLVLPQVWAGTNYARQAK